MNYLHATPHTFGLKFNANAIKGVGQKNLWNFLCLHPGFLHRRHITFVFTSKKLMQSLGFSIDDEHRICIIYVWPVCKMAYFCQVTRFSQVLTICDNCDYVCKTWHTSYEAHGGTCGERLLGNTTDIDHTTLLIHF